MSDKVTPTFPIRNNLFLGLRSSHNNSSKREDSKKENSSKPFSEYLKDQMEKIK